MERFAPFHFPAEMTTFQVELDERYRFHYSFPTPNTLQSQKSAKTVQKTFKNTSNFVKLVGIRTEMLSNFLIHLPNRTRRALSNGHLHTEIAKSQSEITGFLRKPVGIRPEMLSNFLIHFSNRTPRALSHGHHQNSIPCS